MRIRPLLLSALAICACRSADVHVEAAADTRDRHGEVRDAESPAAVPMDLEGRYDSTAGYLLDRYDADGDGAVTSAEYDRGEEPFARLDRNDDGVITADDWERRSHEGRPSRAERMRAMRGRMVVARYFQAEKPEEASLEEVRSSAAGYDTNDDGRVDAEEFTCAYEQREVQLPGRMGRMSRMMDDAPWAALTAAADEDEDGALSLTELERFFTASDDDGDGVWTFRPASTREEEERTAEAERSERPEAPSEGEVAPDFTLAPPEGGEPVTLSSFAGEKPVALVFGSYT